MVKKSRAVKKLNSAKPPKPSIPIKSKKKTSIRSSKNTKPSRKQLTSDEESSEEESNESSEESSEENNESSEERDESSEESSEEESSSSDEEQKVLKRKRVDTEMKNVIAKTSKLSISCKKKPQKSLQVKQPVKQHVKSFEKHSVKRTLECEVNEMVIQTSKLSLNEKENPAKRINLIDNDDNEWALPLENTPNIEKTFSVVSKIKTKYVVIVPYYFTGNPVYCNHWNKHFFEKNMSEFSFRKHWDLMPVFFTFINYNDNTYRSELLKSNDVSIQENDIKVQFNSFVTLILRPLDKNFKKLEEERQDVSLKFKYKVITNLRFVTHYDKQVNIYYGKKIRCPSRTWALHLILNEQSMAPNHMKDVNIHFSGKNTKYVYNLCNLYQALYLHYSERITT